MRTFNAAVLGSPISHSLSPLIHSVAYEALEIPAKYNAVEVKSGKLAEYLDSTPPELNSFSLTMPLKEELINLGFPTSALAQRIKSANTLIKIDGNWKVESTDVIGFQQSVSAKTSATFENILILGAGATARAAIAAFDSAGTQIDVASRSEHRETALRNAALLAEITMIGFDDEIHWPKYDLVINTSPAHAADPLVAGISGASALLFESLYNPWPTALMGFWRNVGLESVDGLDLLVHQAISQIAIFSGKSVNRAKLAPLMREAALKRI
jgi:shikimate dehydrogenase